MLITIVSLVQPGLLLLIGFAYRKYWVKGKIVIHPTSSIQIGYGPNGATVVLTGSLQAVTTNQFVAGMNVTVTNEKTKECHRFDWQAFVVGHQRVTNSGPDSYFEVPAGFMVSPQQGHRYTIMFVDQELQDDQVRPAVRRLEKEWTKNANALHEWAQASLQDPGSRAIVGEKFNATASEIFNNLKSGELYAEVARVLERNCYWRSGWYHLTLHVKTSHPDQAFEHNWRFVLTEEEANSVCGNVEATLAEVCQMPHSPYVIAYVAYHDEASGQARPAKP